MKKVLCFILIVVAFAVFDYGYHIQNHILSVVVKGIAGGLFMTIGAVSFKD